MATRKRVDYNRKSLDQARADPRFTLVGGVEKFVGFPPPGHRLDLWGVIDIVAIGPGITLGIQSTSIGALSAHKKKLREEPNTVLIVEAGWLLEIWAWEQVKGPGTRWSCRVIKFEVAAPDA